MFKSVNVFQVVVLVLILVGVVMIFMRQNNTCVMKQNKVKEGFTEDCIPRWRAGGGDFREFSNHNLGGSQWPIIEYVNDEAEAFNRCLPNSNCAGIVHTNWDNRFYLKKGTNIPRARKRHLVSAANHNTWLKTCDS